ncbi:DUF309 domain-containing protein [Geothermobacter hydrogeniphilus]|uniref:DUF309 domain-containing protein n=1 Tax=Geothermobacter hydrogeniphilus TaxID=1969733 RepID=A0A1X0XW52_9BACT|nr:DUF309 domain-containing protein [Geothermobacter hydrogeniphilus]ORJ57115.1 hypothetical protein B5V00_14370 [Geothermobacter hydrogeniphilus]
MRRYSDQPFPAYRHRLDRTPHPTRDPRGHSYGLPEPIPLSCSQRNWPGCEPYLYGVDLFNHGYFWEAHTAFEQVWLAEGRETVNGLFFQGLIQIAAGFLKLAGGEPDNARMLVELGIEKLPTEPEVFFGLQLSPFITRIRESLENEAIPPIIELQIENSF